MAGLVTGGTELCLKNANIEKNNTNKRNVEGMSCALSLSPIVKGCPLLNYQISRKSDQ